MPSGELRYAQSPLRIDYSSKNLLRMNLNENLVLPINRMRSIIAKCADEYHPRFYTSQTGEGELGALVEEIAKYCSCAKSSVALGSGSDQILDLIFRAKFARKTGKLVTVDPTYSIYAILAKRMGASISYVKLGPSTAASPFQLDARKLIQSSRKADVIVLASPNNPTGIQYPCEVVVEILETLPDTALILDEAYVEYGSYSATKFLSKKNLIVVRTFSKAFGLANLRLGYLLSSDSDFVDKINYDLQYPYAVSGFAVLMATELLRRKSLVTEFAEKTKQYRKELIEGLEKLDLAVIPIADANFVLVRSKVAKRIAQDLLSEYAIAVKFIPRLGEETGFLRITVGSRENNERLLYSLRRIAGRFEG